MAEKKRVLFVTVGTTALYAEELGQMSNDQAELKRLIGEYRSKDDDLEKAAYAAKENIFGRALEAHQQHWKGKDPIGSEPYRTSAELTSTYLLMVASAEGFHGLFRPGEDRIVLLASDTAVGKFGARLNAQMMNQLMFAPSCDCKANFKESDHCKSISIEIINKMEASKGFASIHEKLAEIMKRQSAGNPDLFFNITGGYKGAIPAITWLCGKDYPGCPLYYQHESMNSAVRIDFRPQWKETLIPLQFVNR